MNLITTIIKSRHSVRKFKTDPLDEIAITDALECAAKAPTAMNVQPWIFGVVRDPAVKGKIADCTEHGKFIRDAPACFAVFGEKRHPYYLEDCCAATENLILALQAYGINSCWVAGDKKPYAEKVRLLLGVPDTHGLVALVASGFPAEINPAAKKPLKKMVFYDSFGSE
jgi:nitroreductase